MHHDNIYFKFEYQGHQVQKGQSHKITQNLLKNNKNFKYKKVMVKCKKVKECYNFILDVDFISIILGGTLSILKRVVGLRLKGILVAP